jgi:hypothetical protein
MTELEHVHQVVEESSHSFLERTVPVYRPCSNHTRDLQGETDPASELES